MNAAQYLLSFFQQKNMSNAFENGFTRLDVTSALQEIESEIDTWERMGDDVSIMRTCVKHWTNIIVTAFAERNGWDGHEKANMYASIRVNAGDMLAMKTIADKMTGCTVHFTDEQKEKLRSLLTDSRKVLGEIADTMPEGLALYVSRLLTETETALSEYDITGDFALEKAFARLRMALDITMVQMPKEKSSKWDGVKNALSEIAIGFIIEAPSVALTAATIFPQIAPGQ